MEILFVIVLVAFLFGLISRKKGDSFLDTLGSGCNSMINIVLIIILILCAIVYFNGK